MQRPLAPPTPPAPEQCAAPIPKLDTIDRKWLLMLAHVQCRGKYRGRPLWGFIRDVTGVGSHSAFQIARECGWDPEQPGDKALTTVL